MKNAKGENGKDKNIRDQISPKRAANGSTIPSRRPTKRRKREIVERKKRKRASAQRFMPWGPSNGSRYMFDSGRKERTYGELG